MGTISRAVGWTGGFILDILVLASGIYYIFWRFC